MATKAENDRAQIIADYIAAYCVANPHRTAPLVDYFKGWYSVFTGITGTKYRKSDMIAMTDRLLIRAQAVPNT